MRTDYKIDRNKQMYDEYISKDTSFNKLAQKYGVSPQRVRYIINDYKGRDLPAALDPKAPKETREKYKNRAVELREAGKVDLSLTMFDEIIAWDEANDNLRGKTDVLGHKKISLTHLAERSNDKDEKVDFYEKAAACITEGIKIAQSDPNVPEGNIAIQHVHLASVLLSQGIEESSREKKVKKLEEALKYINDGIAKLPGSKAHKAWPALTKARILYELERVDDAYKTLFDGQVALIEGYEEELGWADTRVKKESDKKLNLVGNDQSVLKLRVWSSGISLGFAEILRKEGKHKLAEIYASAVIATPDPDGTLKLRKDQAKRILEQLK